MSEVICDRSVLAFDGQVVEAFGFLNKNAQRVHVQQMKNLELKGSKLRIEYEPNQRLDLFIDGDDGKLAEVQGLVDEVRSAAPNLEEG